MLFQKITKCGLSALIAGTTLRAFRASRVCLATLQCSPSLLKVILLVGRENLEGK